MANYTNSLEIKVTPSSRTGKICLGVVLLSAVGFALAIGRGTGRVTLPIKASAIVATNTSAKATIAHIGKKGVSGMIRNPYRVSNNVCRGRGPALTVFSAASSRKSFQMAVDIRLTSIGRRQASKTHGDAPSWIASRVVGRFKYLLGVRRINGVQRYIRWRKVTENLKFGSMEYVLPSFSFGDCFYLQPQTVLCDSAG